MADVHLIRLLHERQGWSERRIAKELGMARKTVHKYLVQDGGTAEPRYARRVRVVAPKMGEYGELIDRWLIEDQQAPAKQRHTARRIYDRLVREYGATDLAERTVRRYVASRRRALGQVSPPAFLVLEFSPGELAQVDWGEATVLLAGEKVRVWMFCMRLGYSTAAYVQLFPHARMECWLEGHVQAFSYLGGVPRQVMYDNLASAVQVRRMVYGRHRELNPQFAALAGHYVFEPVFATPRAGWEKGLVEGLVGYSRRNYLVPLPEGENLAEINARIRQRLIADLGRPAHQRDGRTVGDLLAEERPHLHLPPRGPFRACLSRTVRATRQALVHHQRVAYSVPAQLAGRELVVEAYADRVEIYDGPHCVAQHPLGRPGQGPVLVLDHYLDVLGAKPGGVRHARVVRQLGEEVMAYQAAYLKARPDDYAGFVQILMLSRRYTLGAVLEGIAQARRERVYDPPAVEERLRAKLGLTCAASEAVDLRGWGPKVAEARLDVYDRLVRGVGS